MKSIRTVLAVALAAGLALLIAACGSSSSSTSSTSGTASASGALSTGGYKSPLTEALTGGKRGGTLTVLQEIDFEHLDPGISYFSVDYAVVFATQRPLYSQKPDSTEPTPDLAEGQPEISNGGKTVTVHIKQGVDFSPPVNREVTSEDVAYAIERGTNPDVANPYIASYFKSVEGEPADMTGAPMKGIETPNKHEIVFHLTEPKGQIVADALVLPLTAPVPKEYAEKFDKNKPSNYVDYEVATGPYMLKNNSEGKVLGIGYVPGKSATLVRNPNWKASTDYRPAYLNGVNFNIGGDATVIGQQVLKGSDSVQFDTPSQSTVKLAYEQYPSQITFTSGAGDHYVALDNAHGPFTNVNLRRAAWANLDRAAIIKLRGGRLTGQPATHFIYPGVDGYDQSGGAAGPPVPWNANVNGSLSVATTYMKAAGYPSGKYTGSATVQIVGANNGNDPAIIQLVNTDLTQLGFHTHVSLVDQSVMYAKYCGVPKQEIDACPTVGWVRDFADPLTVLYVPFYGPAITSTNNSNWGQVNEPAINTAMDKAALVTDPTARAQAWANVDKMLVNQAVAIPEDFDNQANVESGDVLGVDQLWNTGTWDLAFTSLKNP